MTRELPPFASQWVKQWKEAAPKLQAIRDEELRCRNADGEGVNARGNASPVVAGVRVYQRNPERHGMVIMQRWWMRRYLLQQTATTFADQSSKRNRKED